MIQAASFMHQARERGFRLFTGVPCSYLKPFINYALDAPELDYVGAANEGDAVAIAAGADLAGRRSVVMFQNSGLGNAVNPLTSLNAPFRIPALLIVTWRGEPGGGPDEPQHELMGQITPRMLDLLGIRWEFFPTSEADVASALDRAVGHMDATRLPFALVMRKGSVAPHALQPRPALSPLATEAYQPGPSLDHAVWFHQPIRLDDWVLMDLVPHRIARGRGWYTGTLHNRHGVLGASLTQESLYRARRGTP